MEVKYIRKNGKRLDIRKHVGKRLNCFTVCQGATSDGKHLYIAFERKKKKQRLQAIKIVKMDLRTMKVIKVSSALRIGHANDMCIKGNMLYITHSAGEHIVHQVNADTLKWESYIDLERGEFNGVARYGSGFILRRMGGRKMFIVNKRWHRVKMIETEKNYTTSQGMDQKGGVIYRTYSKAQSSDKNYLVTFDKHGRLIKRRRVEVTGELECVFLVDGDPWFLIYRKKRVKGKMKYMAFIAKGA